MSAATIQIRLGGGLGRLAGWFANEFWGAASSAQRPYKSRGDGVGLGARHVGDAEKETRDDLDGEAADL